MGFGAVTCGIAGLVGGAGFVLLCWWHWEWLIEAWEEERDRRERDER
jgi:hypothetical protein